jgi:hypothetical protein
MASDDVKTESDVGGALPSGRFEGRLAFEDLILKAFQNAATAGWSEVILSDADFSDWPLNQSVVIVQCLGWNRAQTDTSGEPVRRRASSSSTFYRLAPNLGSSG